MVIYRKLFYIINIILLSNQISYKTIIGKDTRFLHHGIWCVVHSNAVVLIDVPDNAIAVGVPARMSVNENTNPLENGML